MDVGVAGAADHEGLATPPCHDLHPLRSLGRSGLVEIGQLADLVDLHPIRFPADLATPGQKPADQLLAGSDRGVRHAVSQDRVLLPTKRNAAEGRDQWVAFCPRRARP